MLALPPDAPRIWPGGAYDLGSAAAYRNFARQIAEGAKTAIFIVQYGLAPEHVCNRLEDLPHQSLVLRCRSVQFEDLLARSRN
ncbi:MAG TPA: alpha/beta hydrolase fold domain-containing protein [Candidatus Polarisedimenticolia bacterium]|nr:alpha/beta hydrolase fold domain-containing protein [Candidatus Polarisedimenticolia bacterium]